MKLRKVFAAFIAAAMVVALAVPASAGQAAYDYAADIAGQKEATALVPAAAEIGITAADENGASGVVLTASPEEGNTTDFYLNALVAGNKVILTGDIASAVSSVSGDIAVADGKAEFVPAPMMLAELVDEVVAVTMADGTVYNVHTVNPLMPKLNIIVNKVAEENAGFYDFVVDKFLLRVSTAGELVYFRNCNCVGEALMCENFAKQGDAYTYFVELQPEYRNANGGYSSGMYVVMDSSYVDVEKVTLAASEGHGEGYLDQHEFVIIEPAHYLLLSYTLEEVNNLPEGVAGIDGTSRTYVWAGVMQEVKDGALVAEIDTTDYPLLYESAVEKLDYANATLDGVVVTVGQNEVPSFADGIMDYVHINSMDYILNDEGTVAKLLVSMRDQCAVYQFDMATGEIDWILGGKASTLTGFDEFTTVRTDEMGNEFNALTYGQHYARYCEDGDISIFDNQTGMGPFLRKMPVPTMTRVFKATIDAEAGTATIHDVINGVDLDEQTGKYHNSSHCGSVDYFAPTSVLIGWGLHGVIDNLGPFVPEGTQSDIGFDDLRQGSIPIFTELDQTTGEITFELSTERSPLLQSHEGMFSYRTYKSFK
ncbi:MAG: aryl-sulfate sulfotransferase [Parasporobacterium sp.]|nr:aryl-sulfate sulfotransferase [Parasporobacterium sp.]